MEKIIRVQDKPEWFILENYDVLLDITIEELVYQLDARMPYYHLPYDECCETGFKQVINGNPIFVPISDAYIEEQRKKHPPLFPDREPSLSNTENVHPVTFRGLHRAGLIAKENGAFIDGKVSRDYSEASFSCMEAKLIRKRVSTHYAPITVMLELFLDATDEEILQDIGQLLPEWRQQQKADELPLNSGRMGDMRLAKLILQRTIPLIDLMIWQRNMGVEITNEVLARVLFDCNATKYPSGPDIKRIYMQAAEKAISEDFLRSANLFLMSNTALASRKVSDHLAINRCVYP